jgi:membrane-associated phospholipid phosphatase
VPRVVVVKRQLSISHRHLHWAVFGLLLFAGWTLLVRDTLSANRASSVWRSQSFGSWPQHFGAADGYDNDRFSMYASFLVDPSGSTQVFSPALVGSISVGQRTDREDGENINGMRFVTSSIAASLTAISVFVRAPIDASPHDAYQVAVYTDGEDAPDKLVASSYTGSLTADTWNTLPIHAQLLPNHAYWLMFNTNATNPEANNMAYTPGETDPIDALVQARKTPWLDSLAGFLGNLGGPVPALALALLLATALARRNPLASVALLAVLGAGIGIGIGIEAILKQWLLYPAISSYPSGHALRATFLAFIIIALLPWRSMQIIAVMLAVLICVSRVYAGEHYWYEAVGGALAGCALACVVLGFVQGRSPDAVLEARPRQAAP